MVHSMRITSSLAVAALITAGCAQGASGPVVSNQALGAVVGGLAGGVAGNQFGKGRGNTAATIAGTVLGGIVGAAVAQQLSQQGVVAASQTTQQTLTSAPTGSVQRWNDPQTGIYGTVQPTSNVYYAPYQPAQPQYTSTGAYQYQPTPQQTYGTSQGLECRDYETSVVSGGQIEKATGTMCRNSPAEPWRLRNS